MSRTTCHQKISLARSSAVVVSLLTLVCCTVARIPDFEVTGVATEDPPGFESASYAELPSDHDLMRIHLLNVGAGSCHIVECPGSNDVIVYDCGQMNPSPTDMTPQDVAAYFREVVHDDEPVIVLSHADRDHVSLIDQITEKRRPESVWFGGSPDEYKGAIGAWLGSVPADRTYFGWEPHWHGHGQPVRELRCGAAETYVLTVNVGGSTNSESLMLLMRYGNFSIIFSGDAEGLTERSAMTNFDALLEDVTVLLASHHGARSRSSNHQGWADKTSPQIVVYSAGTSHGHPTITAAERYRAALLPARTHGMWVSPGTHEEQRYESFQAEYTTELSGTIVIDTDGTSVYLECSLQPNCF